jgi:DNA-binding MarR family transcriptional regulator
MSASSLTDMARKLIRMVGSLKTHEHEITMRQIGALGVIVENPGCSVRELAAKLGVNRPAMSRALSGLKQMGFVQKTKSKKDRRLVSAQATAKGRAFVERLSNASNG